MLVNFDEAKKIVADQYIAIFRQMQYSDIKILDEETGTHAWGWVFYVEGSDLRSNRFGEHQVWLIMVDRFTGNSDQCSINGSCIPIGEFGLEAMRNAKLKGLV